MTVCFSGSTTLAKVAERSDTLLSHVEAEHSCFLDKPPVCALVGNIDSLLGSSSPHGLSSKMMWPIQIRIRKPALQRPFCCRGGYRRGMVQRRKSGCFPSERKGTQTP